MSLYEIHDPRFARLIHANAGLDVLHRGCRWAEGPVYVPAGRYLLWSDIPNDRIYRWDETADKPTVFREPAFNTNGHTLDLQGRLVSCEHRGRCVSRTGHDGIRRVLVDSWDGKRLNSPNDVVVRSDGTIWFTDPTYGIDSDYEGEAAESEIGASHVYRFDPATGEIAPVATDFVKPNGLAFSPDERLLYVSDTGATHVEDGPRHIRRFAVSADGLTLTGGEVFATCEAGLFDGFRLDTKGHIWTSAGDGVHCYHPDGTLLGKILTGDSCVANVAFGGPRRNRLFICATQWVYAVYVNATGISLLGE
jgi:gluconolactonase